ncbi:hypothetical protein BU26DRAFT_520473 [Trematosphaeria pertusa]|uniref:Uncharacterized protein n=1 Tax=Trematosphaeria pertusa TaxID=390896 RepID=A0A6A6IA25_9PLEO|nr:uncharacterized protein BU26DRAFT_520473 [Trematosphaeria pertusa]KAF2247231.1 hypothetical protein BU26DRAFT_520473 [Trematosphaeria pertusa]
MKLDDYVLIPSYSEAGISELFASFKSGDARRVNSKIDFHSVSPSAVLVSDGKSACRL